MATICRECHEWFKTAQGRNRHWGAKHAYQRRKIPVTAEADAMLNGLVARAQRIAAAYEALKAARTALEAALAAR